MDSAAIDSALREVEGEPDPTLRSLKLASLCTAVFKEAGYQLVVVGGSAIELLTEGSYASGDLDLCTLSSPPIPLRQRQELMGALNAVGGPRNWKVAGMFVDILGPVESFARTPYRELDAPFGPVTITKAEDLLVERVLVSTYPQADATARRCAQLLAASAISGAVTMDWGEVLRLSRLPEYKVEVECRQLIEEVANELGRPNPAH